MDVENYGDMVQSEKEMAERILSDFLIAAVEIRHICHAHDQCGPQCPLYDKEDKDCYFEGHDTVIDTHGHQPWEWKI